MLYTRFVANHIRSALKDTPVILIRGARQTGKSTLVNVIGAELRPPPAYFTLDRIATLDAMNQSGPAFFEPYAGQTVIIDEVQRSPALFTHIKVSVDAHRTPGRFVLTGSADPLKLPNLGDSLAGRMTIIELAPLSQDELLGSPAHFIDALFAERFQPTGAADPRLIERLITGGYPDAVARSDFDRRIQWFDDYANSLIDRDARNLQTIGQPADVMRLLRLLGAQSANLLNNAGLSRTLGMPLATLRSYVALLSRLFMVMELPAWFTNASSRIAKAPKVYISDTGLMTYLLDQNVERLHLPSSANQYGALLETFVVGELRKQLQWNTTRVRMHHFRSHDNHEVDVVLEGPGGRVIGIEVKSTSNPGARDFNGLHALQAAAGDRFLRGVVLYTGDQVLPHGSNLCAVPISALWSTP